MKRYPPATRAALLVGLAACTKAESAPLYEKVPVERRDITVAATAPGVIQPLLTLSVKSKAWGEILALPVQTGDEVQKGQLLAKIDPRIPRDNLSQAQANLDKARAQLENATAQLKRSEALYQSQAIAETDYESAKLAYATAASAVATAEANLQTAKDAMEDTQVRAPITGTVLELDAVLHTVISSPNLGGGTVILKMANLDAVQDSTLVNETDVGKLQPGMPATVTVDAYPDRQFDGRVVKIKPQAQVVQNATVFPVLVGIPNPGHLLKPGMNTHVEIRTGQRQGVLAVPNAALRTQRDVPAAASVLGLDPDVVQQQVAAVPVAPRAGGDTTAGADSGKAHAGKADSGKAHAGKAENGGARRRQSQGGSTGRQTRNASPRSYIVFALRGGKPVPVPIKTGLTDQDYIEVTSGLTEKDTVLVLPSASLVQSQQQFKQRFQNVTGGGLPGLRQQQPQSATSR